MVKFRRSESLNNLSASLENYLETIVMLKRKKKHARIGDIAKSLNVKSSSVNIAINFLAENGLVMHEKYGYVDLTNKGEKIALEIQGKHEVLYRFLSNMLFIDSKIADREACEIEHSVSLETVHRLERLCTLLKEYFLVRDEDSVNLKRYLEKCKNY
ncbi:MAG: metal-dependent transcriptional regulator [Endomicrobium sp.]|jgi:DtxR family Mn-dependent transcriptional regulator|nr:metal-dependent transcriptional regulator [Endomicrobium sp.]